MKSIQPYDSNTSFKEMLEVEHEGQSIADAFYINKLKAINIRRYNYDNPLQRPWQQHDIDCSVQFSPPGVDIFWLNYSEKFRRYETGDMCLELWSNFKKDKPGWALKYPDYGPDAYLYITPLHIFEVWRNGMFERMIDKLTAELTKERVIGLLEKYEGVDNISVPVVVGGHKMTLIKSTTRYSDREYFGVSVAVPWKILWNEYYLQIAMYDRVNYNQLNINEQYIY